MTAADVLEVVRRTLNDEEQEARQRWDDPTLLRYLSSAQRALFQVRSEAFMGPGGVTDRPVELAATTDTMKVDEQFRDPLMHLTCAMALEEDSEDRARPELAQRHREDFATYLRGT